MKVRIFVIIFYCFAFFSASFSYANGITCTRPTIGFFNGMLNTLEAAQINFDALKRELRSYDSFYTKFDLAFNYVLFYNNTQGIRGDFNEVLAQLKNEEDGNKPLSTRTQQDYKAHEEQADFAFKQKTGLLLFGHSQGNFFLNHLYDYCKKNAPNFQRTYSRCEAIQIGSPSSKKTRTQILSNNDVLIKSFFTYTGRNFQPTVTIPYNVQDVTGHGFRETYLNHAMGKDAGLKKLTSTVSLALWNFCPFT